MSNYKIITISLGFVNAYLVDSGNGFFLIDTGIKSVWADLEKSLSEYGCVPGKLKMVLITHGDYDHTGNCAVLQDKYKTKIAIHEADAPMVEKGIVPKRKTRTLSGKIMMFFIKRRSKKFSFDRFKPDIYLKGGEDLKQYGLEAKVIHLPGHTRGSVVFLMKDGELFGGDTLGKRGKKKAHISKFIENMKEIKESVKSIKALNAQIIYPGHGESFVTADIG